MIGPAAGAARYVRTPVFVITLLAMALGACARVGTSVNADPGSVAIATGSLPAAQAGSPYRAALEATGGTAPYNWSLASGGMPEGLLLDPATGTITGTPIASLQGTLALAVVVADSAQPAHTATATLGLTINRASGPPAPATALTVTTTSLPTGQVGVPYSATVSASGGTTPYTWSLLLRTLPGGLSFNTATGAITGTPTTAETTTHQFKVTDSSGLTASAVLSITILPPGLAITTGALPSGQVGVAYSTTLAAVGGTMPYSWSLTSGALPAGLSLSAATGGITGTPTVAVAATPLTIRVADSSNPQQSNSVTLALTIASPGLHVTTSSLPNGQVGVAYSTTLAATGGTAPYTWSLSAGALPAGLSLNSATGAITGTPTASAAATSLTFKATDSSSPQLSTSATLTLTITSAGLRITTTTLPGGQVGVAYSATLAATGGTPPYSWSLTGGTLPAGLSLNAATGAITGTPTVAVLAASLTFNVADSSTPQQVGSANLMLAIASPGLHVTTISLPNAQVGVAYSTAVTAAGGTTPYTWSLLLRTLPSGLSFNTATGAITGTPTKAKTTTHEFKVTDSSNPAQTASAILPLTVLPPGLAVTTTSLPAGQVGVAYSATLTASGGTTPYTWSLTSGTLPAGLALNAATGAISGTPSTAMSPASLTFKVSDSGNPVNSASTTLSLSVAPATLVVTTTSLPSGQVGAAYSASLAALGGTAPYSWSLSSGTLPAGLSLNAATGALTGTPTAAVSASSITFKVTDSGNPAQSASATLSLTIAPAALAVTTTSLPAGQVGVAYSTTLGASGGTAPYAWSVSNGTLPAGLSLNAASGALTGTPTAAVSASSITFKVTDSGNPAQSASATLSLTIASATLVVTTTSLPNGQVGVAYSATLAAIGGTKPYSWSVTSGTLPAGLTLNTATGAITGTPTATFAATFLTFTVTDAGNPPQNALAALSLTVTAATLAITTTSLPSGQVGVAYATTLSASGGTAPYAWSISSGALPTGLSLNAATGAITGTPTAAVSATSLTFKVTDSANPALSASATLPLTINAAALTITTTSLPNGQVGATYATTLGASGGTLPYTWTLSSGTLPAGLTLNAATGAISGTPSAAVSASSLTFKVTDSSNPTQNASVVLSLTIIPAPLAITTTSLPGGQVGTAYAAGLAASGGTLPYTWTLTSGTLPSGLSLGAAGLISGTPTAAVTATPLTFKVTDASSPVQSQSVALALTISNASGITVAITPARAALTTGQALQVSATTNDTAGVNWALTPAGGSISPPSSLSGVNVTLTAPASAGVYTLTATSITDATKSASVAIGVTDLPGVLTYHNDLARDGANTQEYALTTTNVKTASFGKLFTCPLDGAVYAQPLWVANRMIAGARHNVVIVATQHDSLYAIDADTAPCTQLWQVSLIDTSHGGAAGETTVPGGPGGNLIGQGAGDITPEVGVTSTPVIDAAAGIVYVVSKSVDSTGTSFFQRLHAIDLATGAEKPGSPVALAATFPGSGDGGSVVTFSPRQQNQRAGLALVNGTVYAASGSHEDTTPFRGWLLGYSYNGSAFTQAAAFCSAPNASTTTAGAGIWMSGAAPAADSNGHLYVITGNGPFDITNASAPNTDYGDSFLQMTGALAVTSYFTPSGQASDFANDFDQGSGGAAIVLNLASGSPAHLVVGGGKDGNVILLNGDSMGGLGDANALERFFVGGNIFSTGAFWNNNLYMAAVGSPLHLYPFNTTTKRLATSAASQTAVSFAFPGPTPSVSASGTTNGIVWALDNAKYCTPQSPGCGPSVLHAYDATNLGTELWNSSMVAGDAAGNAVKFAVPTVANGRIYVGTRGNNTGGVYGSGGIYGELEVYGLKAQ